MATLTQLRTALANAYAHYEISSAEYVPTGSRAWENAGDVTISYYRVRALEERSDHTFAIHVHTVTRHEDGQGASTYWIDRVPSAAAEDRGALLSWCISQYDKVIKFQYNSELRTASALVDDNGTVKAVLVGEDGQGSYEALDVSTSTLNSPVV